MSRQRLLALVIAFSPVVAADATPPAGQPINPELGRWFKSLSQPGTGEGCCSIADCRPFDSRIVRDHYEVFIHDKWFPVPNDVVLHRENKLGVAIACLRTSWNYNFGPAPPNYIPGILCFVPGPET
jgi:hypothetical protein